MFQKDQAVDPMFCIKPIGYLESCFREKFGTPRQSKPYSSFANYLFD